MNEMQYTAMCLRIEALEARIAVMEQKLAGKGAQDAILEALHVEHGDEMTKQTASELLDVSRCTIYNMIKDGRLSENERGRIVTTSLLQYMAARATPREKKK